MKVAQEGGMSEPEKSSQWRYRHGLQRKEPLPDAMACGPRGFREGHWHRRHDWAFDGVDPWHPKGCQEYEDAYRAGWNVANLELDR